MTYTLEEISSVFRIKSILTKDRFKYYFINLYGYSERETNELFKVFWEFPKGISEAKNHAILEDVVGKCLKILKFQEENTLYPLETGLWKENGDRIKDSRKFLYKENDELKELVIDFKDSRDVILYSNIIQRDIKSIALLKYNSTISLRSSNNSSEYLDVFEGDIFTTHDDWRHYAPSPLVVADSSNGNFHVVLYTQGRGYIRNGVLDIVDKTNYSSYMVTGKEFTKLGNFFTHKHLLIDDNILKVIPDFKNENLEEK